jgi:D-aspartate ligase
LDNNRLKALNKPIPIILGGNVNGLGLVRSFGHVGVPAIYLDKHKSLPFYSKYCISYLCPDPEVAEESFIQYLIDFGKNLPQKGVLFAAGDVWLVTISKHREKLSQYYLFPMSEWEIIENCWNKRKLYEIAQENGIPCAKTYFIHNILELDALINEIRFPCVIKPEVNIGFKEILGSGPTITVSNYTQMIHWKKAIIEKGLGEVPLILQELIEGPITNLYTITSYSNNDADIVAYSTGYKIRQYPPVAGTIISGRVKDNPEIYDLGAKLIKLLRYYGIANTEFKKDERDQTFKLIEINPRPGVWNYSVLMSGVNLPYIAYLDLLGEPFESLSCSKDGKVWMIFLKDFFFSIFLFRRIGYPEYAISFTEWFRSTRGKKIFAIESLTDPLPGLVNAFKFFSKPIYKLKKVKRLKN